MSPSEFSHLFPQTDAVLCQGRERGLHHGVQLYVSLRNQVLADVGLGLAAPDVPMTPDVSLPWLSAGKPLTAVLIAQLQESGQLQWDDRVSDILPEFAGAGKSAITIRHILTHTAGLAGIDHGWPDIDWQESLQRIHAARLDPSWIVGESAAYDPGTSWFVLGEIIQRITGHAFATCLTQRLLTPLDLTATTAGIEPDSPMKQEITLGWMWERIRGELVAAHWHQPPRIQRISPGSSLRGPIRELGRFYEALGQFRNDVTILKPATIQTLTARQRQGKFDQTLGHVVDFGLGVIVDSRQYGADTVPYGYGSQSSPRTFGHGGAQCAQGFCDPERGLVVAYAFNGRPGEGQHQRRGRALLAAIDADLSQQAAEK